MNMITFIHDNVKVMKNTMWVWLYQSEWPVLLYLKPAWHYCIYYVLLTVKQFVVKHCCYVVYVTESYICLQCEIFRYSMYKYRQEIQVHVIVQAFENTNIVYWTLIISLTDTLTKLSLCTHNHCNFKDRLFTCYKPVNTS